MRTLIGFAVLLAAVAMAGQKPAPKPAPKHQKAEEGFVIVPLVFKDAPCARDYLKAQAAGGLEGRKALGELLLYGCVKKIEGIYYVSVRDAKPIANGLKPALAKFVSLILAACGNSETGE